MISERPVAIPVGPAVTLEGALAEPAGAVAGVVVCHPHPRYGGEMDNPVVLTAAAACARAGLATLRFNFRGVGDSTGGWDEGRGEQDDVRAALAFLKARLAGPAAVGVAGYSFGASMATAVAAAGEPLAGLALIAPPLGAPGWRHTGSLTVAGPLLIVVGSDDQYCPAEALTALARTLTSATVTVIDGTDHFFFSGLEKLDEALTGWAARLGGR
jgi:alpha/beta superfamily hydrolase